MFPGYIYRPGNQNLDEFITEMDEGFSNCNLERWGTDFTRKLKR